MKRELLAELRARVAAGEAAVLATDLETGAAALICAGERMSETVDAAAGALPVSEALRTRARLALAQEEPAIAEVAGRRIFLNVFNPPSRLVIIGAVHITEPLATMAALAGYAVIIIDPRRAFAGRDRFGGARVIDAWPDEALAELAIDARTAIVTLSHDPKLDDAALDAALRSPAFYIGCLGSRKAQAARRCRLAERGFGESDLARIHGPVGLAIGARSPAEIAIAILAEITAIRRQRVGT